MAEQALNETVAAAINATEHLKDAAKLTVVPALTKLENITNQLTYLVFDNQIINSTIGTSALSQLILLSIALSTIVLGSFASIERPCNALPPSEAHPLFDQTDKDCEPTPADGQVSTRTALVLPVLAGVMLVSIYYFIKHYDNVKISDFLNKYVIVMSFSSVSFVLSYLYNSISRNICYSKGWDSTTVNKRYSLTLSNDAEIHPVGFEKELMELPEDTERERIIKEETLKEVRTDKKREDQLFNVYYTSGNIFGYAFGTVFCVLFAHLDGSRNWILNNILGFSIVVMGISRTKIPSFKIATLFLTLFFFYDIYFVFGTDVMLSVATKVEIPAKLVVPNIVSKEENKILTSMLGLGDLALPGAFVALCLRFDLFNFHQQHPGTEFHHLQAFRKPYFVSALIGYTAALAVTFKIVQIYKVGQPALLYLCPGVLFAVYATALCRGELGMLWRYDEMPAEADGDGDGSGSGGGDGGQAVELDIVCSQETLFLSGKIGDEDVDDVDDGDYVDSEASASASASDWESDEDDR